MNHTPLTDHWLSLQLCESLTSVPVRTLKYRCQHRWYGIHQRVAVSTSGQRQYQIHIDAELFTQSARQTFYRTLVPDLAPPRDAEPADIEHEADVIASVSSVNRRKFSKYLNLIHLTENMSRPRIEAFLVTWNAEHPDLKSSYKSIMRERRRYAEAGASGIVGKYGQPGVPALLDDRLYGEFKRLFLSEQKPGLSIIYKYLLGYARQVLGEPDDDAAMARVGSIGAYQRRVERETPRDAIFMARYGESAWNRKYGPYIIRDYADVLAGQVYVGDHHQLDVAVKHEGKYAFPWITVFRDFKSGLWVGWDCYVGNPNSDHIFLAWHRASTDYGIPSTCYIDNGKDYRCRDFSGGRNTVRVAIDEASTRSLLGGLGVEVVFAQPYRAQSKPIERDFRTVKEQFSRLCAGFRGGNVQERPEGLAARIATGAIDTLEDLAVALDTYIRETFSQAIVTSGYRKGKSAAMIWNEESPMAAERGILRRVTDDALRLFCMRTSRPLRIGRNGIYDSEIGQTYYDEWMVARKDEKVYLRRDPQRYGIAHVFAADTDEYLGRGTLVAMTPAMATDETSRAELAAAMRRTARSRAITRQAVENMAYGNARDTARLTAVGSSMACGRVTPVAPDAATLATGMDRVSAKDRADERAGLADITGLAASPRPKRPALALFECEREIAPLAANAD